LGGPTIVISSTLRLSHRAKRDADEITDATPTIAMRSVGWAHTAGRRTEALTPKQCLAKRGQRLRRGLHTKDICLGAIFVVRFTYIYIYIHIHVFIYTHTYVAVANLSQAGSSWLLKSSLVTEVQFLNALFLRLGGFSLCGRFTCRVACSYSVAVSEVTHSLAGSLAVVARAAYSAAFLHARPANSRTPV